MNTMIKWRKTRTNHTPLYRGDNAVRIEVHLTHGYYTAYNLWRKKDRLGSFYCTDGGAPYFKTLTEAKLAATCDYFEAQYKRCTDKTFW